MKKQAQETGVRQVRREGQAVNCTGPERTLVDGFRQPRWVGGLSELVESASGFGVLDLDLLEQVLLAYDQRTLWAAVGWFLERYQERFFVPDQYLATELRADRASGDTAIGTSWRRYFPGFRSGYGQREGVR